MVLKGTVGVRKPVSHLRRRDLERHPVWEYALDEEALPGRDETWVRPVQKATVGCNAYSQLVAADFRMPDGRVLLGFMVVTTAKRMRGIMPGAVVIGQHYLSLPSCSAKEARAKKLGWVLKDRKALCQAVSKTEEGTFPLRYALRVVMAGERVVRSGVVV